MKSSFPWLVLAVGLCLGCGERGGLESGGLVMDRALFEEKPAAHEARAADRDPGLRREDRPGRDRRSDVRDGSRRSASGSEDSWWPGDSRPRDSRPTDRGEEESAGRDSDPLPSRSGRWGKDRSMPSDSMPSRTEKWGKDREMPGDSMPSRREAWGKDRRMPGDSMPSRNFPRRTDPSDDSEG